MRAWVIQDIMEVALNGLVKHVREVKDTSAEHALTLEECEHESKARE